MEIEIDGIWFVDGEARGETEIMNEVKGLGLAFESKDEMEAVGNHGEWRYYTVNEECTMLNAQWTKDG